MPQSFLDHIKLFTSKEAAFPLSERQISSLNYFVMIGALLGTILNLVLEMYELAASTGVAFIIFSLNAIYVKITRSYRLTRIVFYIMCMLFFNSMWYYNYGSEGPILYLLLILFVTVMLFLEGFEKLIMICLLIMNILTMFFIEYYEVFDLGYYSNERTRIVDVYSSLFIYILIFTVMVNILTKLFQEQRKKASEVEQLKRNFLANLNHEIRTPVNIISGFSQLFENATDIEKQKRYSKVINENMQHLLSLVENIIELSEIQQSQVHFQYVLVDIPSFFEEEHTFLKNSLNSHQKNKITTSITISKDIERLYLDIKYIKRIIENILLHSVQYIETGNISIDVKESKKWLSITIEDDGPGFSDSELQSLGQIFNKAENEIDKGVSVGIAISKTLIEMMDGTFSIEMKPTPGTIFSIKIPAHKTLPAQNSLEI